MANTELFDIDIQETVGNATIDAGGVTQMSLVKKTGGSGRDSTDRLRKTRATETSYPCQGIIRIVESNEENALVSDDNNTRINIVLGTMTPSVVHPKTGDIIRVGTTDYRIGRVTITPGEGLAKCLIM